MGDAINSQKNENFSVQLNVNSHADDDARASVETFEALKELQKIGFADSYSTIVFNGIHVPAGCCVDYQHFIVTYGAIQSGDHALVYDQVLEDFDTVLAVHFIAVCSQSMKRIGRVPFDKDEVKDFLRYRASIKSRNK